ncbi:hypothetical protein BDN70DRAFT_870563 [Pholiota conissans]|uniref:Uncharacterized protein n=1 Tax=Pholiota conissans TaxID=109636 RepID=A0A9P5ZE70_9AGAR|nr:hypothetical protein BDN70DRAFT_870563 [Pholiota conissans]
MSLPKRNHYMNSGPMSEYVDICPQNMSRSDLFAFLKTVRVHKEDAIVFHLTQEALFRLQDDEDISELPDPIPAPPIDMTPSQAPNMLSAPSPPPPTHSTAPFLETPTANPLSQCTPSEVPLISQAISLNVVSATSPSPPTPTAPTMLPASQTIPPNKPMSTFPVSAALCGIQPSVQPDLQLPSTSASSVSPQVHDPSPLTLSPSTTNPLPLASTHVTPSELETKGGEGHVKASKKKVKVSKRSDITGAASRKSARTIPPKRKIDEITGGPAKSTSNQAKRKNFAWVNDDGIIIEDEEYQAAKMQQVIPPMDVAEEMSA